MKLLVSLLISLASVAVQAQDFPLVLNGNPDYWYKLYMQEHTRAEGMEAAGKTAIDGLKASLQEANSRISQQNKVSENYAVQVKDLTERAETAEAGQNKAVEELADVKGRTVAGRLLRKARDGLAIVGGVAVLIVTAKLAL